MTLQQIKCFKKTYLQQIDPINEGLMLAVRVTLASLIAVILANSIIHQQAMFLILATVFCMITNPDASKKQQFIGMLLAGVLSALGVLVASIIAHNLLLLLLVTSIAAIVAIYINRFNANYGTGALLALMLIIITGGMPADKITALERMANCLLGLAIGLGINFIVLPQKPIRKLRRGLLVLLSDMTDYFYHTSADCLRGNHINPRHWQIKERILLTLNKMRNVKKIISSQSEAAELLNKLFTAEENLLQSLLPLTSIMTTPANNAAFINILPVLAQFSSATHKLMRNYTHYLQQPSNMLEIQDFLTAIDNLQTEINNIVAATLEKPIIYQWPFDIALFSYQLTTFKKALLDLKAVLLDITR